MVALNFAFKKRSKVNDEPVSDESSALTLAPAETSVGGVNVIRMIQDHGLGQLAEIDAEIAKLEERVLALRAQRKVVLDLVRVIDNKVEE